MPYRNGLPYFRGRGSRQRNTNKYNVHYRGGFISVYNMAGMADAVNSLIESGLSVLSVVPSYSNPQYSRFTNRMWNGREDARLKEQMGDDGLPF